MLLGLDATNRRGGDEGQVELLVNEKSSAGVWQRKGCWRPGR